MSDSVQNTCPRELDQDLMLAGHTRSREQVAMLKEQLMFHYHLGLQVDSEQSDTMEDSKSLTDSEDLSR